MQRPYQGYRFLDSVAAALEQVAERPEASLYPEGATNTDDRLDWSPKDRTDFAENAEAELKSFEGRPKESEALRAAVDYWKENYNVNL